MRDQEKRSATMHVPVISSVCSRRAPSRSMEQMYVDGHFVRSHTVHTSAEKHHKRPCHLSHWCNFWPAQTCVSPLCTSLKWVPELGCLKSPLVSCFSLFFLFFFLFYFFLLSPYPLCPVSVDPGLRMVPWSCTIGRRWSTERMATVGRRGKMGRPPGRITWSWRSRESRWVCLFCLFVGLKGKRGGGKGGCGAGRRQASPWHRQTQVYIVPSLGCNGDSHMLQPACVSKESYQETMQHNNSFPSEASGVEPIVCTLLKLWMLPLLQRAYINLAGSKQQCAASIPSPQLTSPHLAPSRFRIAAIKRRVARVHLLCPLFPAWNKLFAVWC